MTWPAVLFVDQTGQLGGAELCLLDLVTRWEGRSAVLTFEDGPFPERLRSAGIDVRTLDAGMASRKDSGVREFIGDLGRSFTAIRAIAGLADEFDVLSANTQKAAATVAVASRISGTPFVAQLHDLLTSEHFSPSSLAIATRALRRAEKVVADSAATCAAWEARGGDPERTEIVYYGFTRPATRPPLEVRAELGLDPAAFLVGHFSRISPWKGHDVFLEALARVPSVVAIIAGAPLFGEDDVEVALREQAQRLGINERVTFLGFRSDVPDLMSACDLSVHSSTTPEPFGRVIVESMFVGTPVIAADAGGPREIVRPGVDGWLTTPGEVEALAAAILDAATDRERCRSTGAAASTRVESRFGMDRYVERMRTIHAEAAGNR